VSFLKGLFSLLGGVVQAEARVLEDEVARFLQTQMVALRRGIIHLFAACVVLALGCALLLAACGLALWGIYALISPGVGQVGAAFITAAVAVLGGLILVLSACRLQR
jgi:hypothetical protein